MSRVIIIEDDTEFREHLVHLIERRGHEVMSAGDGEEALLKMCSGTPPSLIFLDLMMPGMDGWTFRARVMKEPKLANIPIVVLSGVSGIEGEWMKLGVVDHLSKPVNVEKLFRLIATYAG